MNKQEFTARLRTGLSGLPEADREERIDFYEEMIEDRMEEGLSEEEAVAGIGSPDEVIRQIMDDTPITALIKERVRPKHPMRAWEIILIVLGAPIWLSILLAILSVIFAVVISLWSAVIALFAVAVSLIAAAVACILTAVRAIAIGQLAGMVFMLGAALMSLGIGIILFIVSKGFAKLVTKMCVMIPRGIKRMFVGKEGR